MVEEGSSRVNGGFKVDSCVICKQGFTNDKAVTVTEKGTLNLISFSKERGHYCLIPTCVNVEPPQAKRLCSSMSSFDWKENCMQCRENAKIDARHPEQNKIYNVTTLTMHDNISECCDRRGDTWASEVQKRLCGRLDLVAAEAINHVNCYSRFLLNKSNSLSTECAPGRP